MRSLCFKIVPRDFCIRKEGRCFAYLYDASSEECDGYVFDTTSTYTDYEECGVNSAADVTLPEPDSAQPSIVSYSGCSFTFIQLGVVFSKEKCEELCLNCKLSFFFLSRDFIDMPVHS